MIALAASWVWWSVILMATCVMAVLLAVTAVLIVFGIPFCLWIKYVDEPRTKAMFDRIEKECAERDPSLDYSAEGMMERIMAAGNVGIQESKSDRAEKLGLKVRWE